MANTRDRKNYGSEFKAKVAMEAVPGRLTINQIATQHFWGRLRFKFIPFIAT